MKSKQQLYKEKADWHKENTSKMAVLFNNTCQECKCIADEKSGVIHHLQYTGHDYKKTLEKLLSDNAIIWICKICHQKEHVAFTRAETGQKFRHSGFCAVCDKYAWYGWRKLSWANFPICSSCVKYLLKEKVFVIKKIMVGHYKGKTEIVWGNKQRLTPQDDQFLKALYKKLGRGRFGSMNSFKKKEIKPNTLF